MVSGHNAVYEGLTLQGSTTQRTKIDLLAWYAAAGEVLLSGVEEPSGLCVTEWERVQDGSIKTDVWGIKESVRWLFESIL